MPAVGQAYVAVGGGVAVLGTGLSVTGYTLSSGKQLWQTALDAPLGTEIISVRAWPGVITVGLLAPDGRSRTEVVLNATTGNQLRRYPAAVFGGAVAASRRRPSSSARPTVTSYNNATGRVRWQHKTAGGQSWQVDGQTLYMAESPGGYLGSSQVTALRVIDLATGTRAVAEFPSRQSLLRDAGDGRGRRGAVRIPLRGDRVQRVDGRRAVGEARRGARGNRPGGRPRRPHVARRRAGRRRPGDGHGPRLGPRGRGPGAAGLYVVRDGVALGLNSGANGTAWEYDMAKGQVTYTSPALPWPHFYSDLSGLAAAPRNRVTWWS